MKKIEGCQVAEKSKRTWWGKHVYWTVRTFVRDEFPNAGDPTTFYAVTLVDTKLADRMRMSHAVAMPKEEYLNFLEGMNTIITTR